MNSGYDHGPQEQPYSEAAITTVAQLSPEARLNFIRKTYVLFLAGILSSIAGGVLCLSVDAVAMFALTLLRSPMIAILVLFGATWLATSVSETEGLNYFALFAFTAFIGILFTPVIALYAPETVVQAAFLTTVVFGSLTAYAFISRKDFNYLGGILFVGLIALILGGLANIFFFKSSAGSYWMAWITVFLFSGFILYDTSRIIHRYGENSYCSAALALFLDFFNMFMAILRIVGGRR